MNAKALNQKPPNQQAARILEQYRIQFDQETELAALVLIRTALEMNLLETKTLEEPLLLMAKLSANPTLAMSLMTESEPGMEFKIDLTGTETLEEAAAAILEEIVASLKAMPTALL